MSIVRITPPAVEPVTPEEVRLHAHIDHDVEDADIRLWISTARFRAEVAQRRAFISQVWEMVLDHWPELPLDLPRPPLMELLSVKYRDVTNVETVLFDYVAASTIMVTAAELDIAVGPGEELVFEDIDTFAVSMRVNGGAPVSAGTYRVVPVYNPETAQYDYEFNHAFAIPSSLSPGDSIVLTYESSGTEVGLFTVSTIPMTVPAGTPLPANEDFIVDTTSSRPGRIALAYNVVWPGVTLLPIGGLRIRYRAGYGETAADVPDYIKAAIILYCTYASENRAGEVPEPPKEFFNLLDQERIY